MKKYQDELYPEKETDLTFGKLCEAWLQRKKIKLKHTSYAKYAGLLNDYIIKELGAIPISKLDLAALEQGICRIYDSGSKSKISASVMKTILYLINAVLNYGSRLGYLNPMKAVFELPDTDRKDVITLKPEQESCLVSYLLHHKNDNNLGVMLSLFTGMRLGEVCSLQRKNIDMGKAVIYVKTTVQRIKFDRDDGKTGLMVTSPKSKKSYREIPIPDFLHRYMGGFQMAELEADNYVLGRRTFPYEPRTLQYGFQNILKKCGIEAVNYHCLRHTFASNCIKYGINAKTLSEILGHASVSFTLNRYVHSDMEQKRSQMMLFNNNYENY